MTDVERLLAQMEAQVAAAHLALADEHEAGLRRAAALLLGDAEDLWQLVTTW